MPAKTKTPAVEARTEHDSESITEIWDSPEVVVEAPSKPARKSRAKAATSNGDTPAGETVVETAATDAEAVDVVAVEKPKARKRKKPESPAPTEIAAVTGQAKAEPEAKQSVAEIETVAEQTE